MKDNNSVVHVLVAPSEWNYDIHYRRRRLAEYLLKQSTTQKIVWIYPGNTLSHIITRELDNGIIEVAAPRFPWKLRHFGPFSRPLHSQLVRYISKHIAKYPTAKKVLWFTHLYFPGLVDIEAWNKVVYDCSDNWVAQWTNQSYIEAVKSRIYLKILQIAEDDIFKNSGCIFATSEFLYKKAASKTSSPVFLVENGVEFDKFYNALPGHNLKDVPRPRLGYLGAIDVRIDLALLHKLAEQHRNWSIVLIGPMRPHQSIPEDLSFLIKDNNVRWVPGINPDEVPAYIKELDIGLMPYRDLEFNKGVFALKLFEYLACGLPVVGCGLPSTEKYNRDKIYIHTASDPAQFAAACERAISWAGDRESEISRIELAKEADWQRKFDFMVGTALGNIRMDIRKY
ncbi:MAG: glycosyltransferase [Dehalococcoidia bacterium]|jgi:teichuronic acid biosynthesis glycosyltransferase TuaH